MTLSQTNLYSESYSILKSFIEDNITDPRGRFKANWIHPSLPNINEKSFDGYPFITLQLDVNENTKAFDRSSEKEFRVLIICYSPDATDIDTICDGIVSNMVNETKLTEFDVTELNSSAFNWTLDQNGRKIMWRTLNLILRKRI